MSSPLVKEIGETTISRVPAVTQPKPDLMPLSGEELRHFYNGRSTIEQVSILREKCWT